jgi:SAM-dependent MidA family methyltransferase
MCGGFGLVFDYGHDGSRRTHSLRAYQKHTLINPLEHVGQVQFIFFFQISSDLCILKVDITADVDFGQINDALQNSKSLTFGPVEQR